MPTTLSMRWIPERIARLQRDSLLVSAAWATTPQSDTTITPPVQVVARTATGAPVVLAAAITDERAPSGLGLLVWTRTDSTSRVAAALTTVLKPVLKPGLAETVSDGTGRTATGPAATGRMPEPSAAPIGAGTGTQADPRTTPSNARWLWLLVLVLLGAEMLVRRRD